MTFCFVDTETTGLRLHHDIWEVAYAFDFEPVRSSIVAHSLVHADPTALAMNGYHERMSTFGPHSADEALDFETEFHTRLINTPGVTMVGANVHFDLSRLSRRWGGVEPWHYRAVDIEVYAMPVLGFERPPSLSTLVATLVSLGESVPEPDHTASGDVKTTRAAFHALQGLAAQQRATQQRSGAPS